MHLPGHGAGSDDNGATDGRILVQSGDQGLHVWHAGTAPGVDAGSIRFGRGELFFTVIDAEGDRAAGVVLLPEAGTAQGVLVEASTSRVLGSVDFVWRPWDWPVPSGDARLAVGRRPDTMLSTVVDLATGDTLLELRPCERGRGIDGQALYVLVATGCIPDQQVDPDAPPREGLVDLATGELALDLAPVGGVGVASWGTPGTQPRICWH